MNLKKGLTKVFSSNMITLLAGIVSGLLIPAFLSLDQYAYLKTFTLYVSYIGILHFGFADGLFIKYGGKYEKDINESILKWEHHFFLVFQIAITFIIILFSLIINDKILLAFAVTIIPYNLLIFYKYFYQAIGNFNVYSKILVFPQMIMLLGNLTFIYILKTDNYWLYIYIRLFSYLVIFIILEYKFYRKSKSIKLNINYSIIRKHFKIGFFIMLGNYSLLSFYSIDRWFVKFSFSTEEFAIYSFAITMMNVITVFVNSITTVFYPYLSRNSSEKKLKKLKNYFIIIASFASGSYFFFAFIVNNYIYKHVLALNVISIIFVSFPAIVIIKALYVNLYKSKKNEKLYVKTVILMLTASIFLNFVALKMVGNNISIATATTISFYIWYYYSSHHFKGLEINIKEVLYLTLFIGLFIYTTNFTSLYRGIIIFTINLMFLIFIFFKKDFNDLIIELTNK